MFRVKEQEDGTFWVVDSAGKSIDKNLNFYSEAIERAIEHNLRMKGVKVCIHCPAVMDAGDTTCIDCGGEQ